MLAAFIPAFFLSMIVSANPLTAHPSGVVSSDAATQKYEHLTFLHTTSLAKAARAQAALPAVEAGFEVRKEERGFRAADVRPALHTALAAAAASVPIPSTAGRRVVAPDTGFGGFTGVTHFDQRNAGADVYTNSQFSLEPPDQGLCVGNGYVMEPVNNALKVYAQNGVPITGAVAMSQFFGVAPEVIRPGGPYGPFISDPRCYFDRDTQRWFVTELEFETNPSTGADSGPSALLIAISQTSNPLGGFNVFSIDTTDYDHPGCPCFGDQPLIGTDANGFYVTTNEFSVFNPTFNGVQLYAFSKYALGLGNLPTVVHLDVGSLATPDRGGVWYSLQPAESPDAHSGKTVRNGSEFFLSALDFFNKNDNRVAVWALLNTASLLDVHPKLSLVHAVVRTEAYGQPPVAAQKPGSRPLGESLKEPEEDLNTNDDRMNQVVYARGYLWAGVNTAVKVGGKVQAGTAFFVLDPSLAKSTVSVVGQGYVAVAGQNTLFPSIGVTRAGKAILACSLSGPDFFPSATYVPLTRGNDPLRLAGNGVLPDDGFTGYAAYGGAGVGRWGDYSAAVADEYGNLWFAAEYVPGSPRTTLANWGTFVGVLPAF